jgi:hypothetical protein
MKRRPRQTCNLSESIHQQLNMYALAASAAGVGMLALAPPAAGEIVFTKVHKTIPYNHGALFFDMKNDGVHDFALSGQLSTTTSGKFAKLNVYAARRGNDVWSAQSRGHLCAAAVPKGKFIGPTRKFSPNELVMFFISTRFGTGSVYGPWIGVPLSYLGLKIEINGKAHYGWARVNFLAHSTVLTGYAYETIAGKAIKAGQTIESGDLTHPDFDPDESLTSPIPDRPQPASLGMLAFGAQGLTLWRRKEPVVTTQ